MIARPRGKPIHYLQNVERWIWLLIGGGALVFIGIVLVLALVYPDTPANQLVTWWNGWLLSALPLVGLPAMRTAAADQRPDPGALPALRQYAARRLSGTRIACFLGMEVPMRTLILVLFLFSTAAFAQTAGDATRGNTPPGMSQDGSRPADGALKGGSILPGEAAGVPNKDSTTSSTERLKRCDELNGALREDCLDRERSAAGGSSAPRPRNKETPIEREQDLKRSPD